MTSHQPQPPDRPEPGGRDRRPPDGGHHQAVPADLPALDGRAGAGEAGPAGMPVPAGGGGWRVYRVEVSRADRAPIEPARPAPQVYYTATDDAAAVQTATGIVRARCGEAPGYGCVTTPSSVRLTDTMVWAIGVAEIEVAGAAQRVTYLRYDHSTAALDMGEADDERVAPVSDNHHNTAHNTAHHNAGDRGVNVWHGGADTWLAGQGPARQGPAGNGPAGEGPAGMGGEWNRRGGGAGWEYR
jgi:hypothetical protein